MLSLRFKMTLSIILVIIAASLIVLFELINNYVIKIDFKLFDFETYNKINGESMLYILKSAVVFTMFSAFALITVPLYLFRKENIFIAYGICFLITLGIIIPEIISIFKDIKGFWDVVVGILSSITLFIIFGGNIILPIRVVKGLCAKKVEDKGEESVDDKTILKYTLIAFILVFVFNFLINFIWLFLTVFAELLGMIVGVVLFLGCFKLMPIFIPRIIIF